MAFGGDGRGNVLDALLAKLGVDPDELEEAEDPPDRIGSGTRRVPLSELGDWFVPIVSLVRKGQVPKARVIALKSMEEEGMAASNERFLQAIIRAALGRPEGDDLAVLEARLEALEPTAGPEGAKVTAVATKSHQGARPDRDHLGRRISKPHGLQGKGGL